MNSKFSEFFRLASFEEKERVWLDIAKQASSDQLAIINEVQQTNDFVSMLEKMDTN